MKLRIPVSAIMTYNLIKLNIGDDITKAELLFNNNQIRHIPVMDGQAFVGMLSHSDLLKVNSFEEAYENSYSADVLVATRVKIDQIMTKNIVAVTPGTTIKQAAEILSKGDFHALPVLDNGILIGIVTTTDLLKYLINQY